MTLKKYKKFILFILILLVTISCRSNIDPFEEDLEKEIYFQRGIEAMDRDNYKLALSYYQAAQQKFPDDTYTNVWATYEIANIYYKMKKYENSLELLDGLILLYEEDTAGVYPPAPLILARIVKDKITEKMKTKKDRREEEAEEENQENNKDIE